MTKFWKNARSRLVTAAFVLSVVVVAVGSVGAGSVAADDAGWDRLVTADPDGETEYGSLEAAIDAVDTDGEVIFVDPSYDAADAGERTTGVVVDTDHTGLTITTDRDEPATLVTEADDDGSVLEIVSDGVTVEHLDIRRTGAGDDTDPRAVVVDGDGAVLDRLALTGENLSGDDRGLEVRSVADVELAASKVQNFSIGASVSADELEMRNTVFEGNEIGVLVTDSDEVTARGNLFLENELGFMVPGEAVILADELPDDEPTVPDDGTDSDEVTIEDNAFGENEIALMVDAADVTVTGNVFGHNYFAAIVEADDGVVEDNSFGGGEYGLLLSGGTVTATQNVAADNRFGIILQTADSPTASENEITGNHGVGLVTTENTTVSENTLSENDVGVGIGGDNVTMRYNAVLENEVGIDVAAGANSTAISSNDIVGNDVGLEYAGDGTLDATLNWWGDASGPSGDGLGNGDAVVGNVDYVPWLDAPFGEGGEPSVDLESYAVDGEFTVESVRTAVDDWRTGDLEQAALREVIRLWRGG